MFRSLHTQLSLIFAGFLLLVGGSVTATFLAVHAQADDALLINLAGRQRMLTQRMIWLAMAQPDSPELASTIQLFDDTLHALIEGGATWDTNGATVYLPPAPDAGLRAQLETVAGAWPVFRSHLRPADPAALQMESPLILAQIDVVVGGLEARAEAKIARLRLIQIVFVGTALGLLTWGYALIRRHILKPLAELNRAAQRIGAGNLADPIPRGNDDEFGALARAFDTMRAEVAEAHSRLEARVAQRTQELASAFEISQEIVAQFNVGHLLRSITDRVQALTRAKTASLCMLTSDGEHLELVANSGEAAGHAELRQPMRRGLAARVIGAGETVVIDADCSSCGFLCAHAPGQCVAAPLRVGQRTLGALCAVRDNGQRFDEDETRALTLLANSAAIAIANAQLAEAGRQQAEQAARNAERERLAAELHDNLAQTLGFLALKTDKISEALAAGQNGEASLELGRVKSAVTAAYGQVRAALVGLREPSPGVGGFAERLAAAVAEFREASRLQVEVNIVDPSALALPQLTQTQALHIVREALANVRRHAQARRVQIYVERINRETRFAVEDDGCGFELQKVSSENHLGLAIMRARAERSGGRLAIVSAPGAGTRIIALFPTADHASVPRATFVEATP